MQNGSIYTPRRRMFDTTGASLRAVVAPVTVATFDPEATFGGADVLASYNGDASLESAIAADVVRLYGKAA